MKFTRIFLISIVCLSLPSLTLASGSGHSHSNNDDKTSGKEKITHISSEHLRIDTKTVNGVRARIDIVSLGEVQKKGDKLFTHQITATFTNAKSGKVVNNGSVALRFTKDHDDTGNFMAFSPTGNGFETYMFLSNKGEQHMMLAAKLNEEKVRQFHFHFNIK